MADAKGIDVSNFAGNFDWASTSGLSFGICRASQGLGGSGTNSPDPYLAWNWPRIKAKGLARGAYHFLDPALSGAVPSQGGEEIATQPVTGPDGLRPDPELAAVINHDTTEEGFGAVDPDDALSALREAPVSFENGDGTPRLAVAMGATNDLTELTLDDERETGSPS